MYCGGQSPEHMSHAQRMTRWLPCTHKENGLVVGFEVRMDEKQDPDAVRLFTDPETMRRRLSHTLGIANTHSSLVCVQFLHVLHAKADGLAAGETVASRR